MNSKKPIDNKTKSTFFEVVEVMLYWVGGILLIAVSSVILYYIVVLILFFVK